MGKQTLHAIMDNMIATLSLFLLASAPQTTTFTGEWLLTWDQMRRNTSAFRSRRMALRLKSHGKTRASNVR